MNKEKKKQQPRKYYGVRLKSGMENLTKKTTLKIILSLSIMSYIFLSVYVKYSIDKIEIDLLHNGLNILSNIALPFIGIIGFCMLIIKMGLPDARKLNYDLRRIGLVNSVKEPPILLSKIKNKKTNSVEYTFYFNCVVKQQFDDKKESLAEILDMDIVDINYRIKGKRTKKMNKHYIVVTCVPLDSIPEKIYWNDKYLQTDKNIITLGVNWLGAVTADLRKTPHMLIGGSSGCGKTVLCRSLIYQFVSHGDTVFIADFKGIDFYEEQETGYTVVTDEAEFKNLLSNILNELDTRKAIFRQAHARNLSQYNKKNPDNQLLRIVLFVDEAAEILDATGLPKEQKAEIAEITSLLSRGARKYRALGLTLCICTQRPSNDIISGQIKNNLDLRIAGKCDSVLSDIILDTTEAARQIPKDSVGLFFSNTAGLFRGFLLDDTEE